MALLLFSISPSTARTAVITLANGDKLSGEIIEETDAHVVLEHPVLGRVKMERSQLQGPAPEPAGLLGTNFLKAWQRRFELGISGSSGNTNEQDFRAALLATRETDELRWRFDSRYRVQRSDYKSTRSDFTAALSRDWLFEGSPWFTFAAIRFEWDQFKDWDNRVIGSGGVGYEFLEREDFTLRGRTGASLSRRSGVKDDLIPEILLGLESSWQISAAQELRWATAFFPSLDELGEYRSVSSLEWVVSLDEADGISFKLGLENEYESNVSRDTARNDLSYYGALVFDF